MLVERPFKVVCRTRDRTYAMTLRAELIIDYNNNITPFVFRLTCVEKCFMIAKNIRQISSGPIIFELGTH